MDPLGHGIQSHWNIDAEESTGYTAESESSTACRSHHIGVGEAAGGLGPRSWL